MTERAAARFVVLQHATRVFKCGCELVLDAAGRGEWRPCSECGPYMAALERWSLIAGLVVGSP